MSQPQPQPGPMFPPGVSTGLPHPGDKNGRPVNGPGGGSQDRYFSTPIAKGTPIISEQFEGFKELLAKLSKLEKEVTIEVKAIGREAAGELAAAMRARAPVGSGHDPHPGRLRDTIRPGVTKYGALVRIGNATTPYTKPIVFGWPARHIHPNPFPYEVLDARRGAVVATYETRINTLVEKVMA